MADRSCIPDQGVNWMNSDGFNVFLNITAQNGDKPSCDVWKDSDFHLVDCCVNEEDQIYIGGNIYSEDDKSDNKCTAHLSFEVHRTFVQLKETGLLYSCLQ